MQMLNDYRGTENRDFCHGITLPLFVPSHRFSPNSTFTEIGTNRLSSSYDFHRRYTIVIFRHINRSFYLGPTYLLTLQ